MAGRALAMLALWFVSVLAPTRALAWGANAQRLISNKAIETLPSELRPFFEANRDFTVKHSTDPLEQLAKNSADRRNRLFMLDRYGKFPYESFPRNYRTALAKYGKTRLETNGVLPWEVGLYSEKLTNAFKAHNWDEVRPLAALLAYFVAETHDPFNTTEDFEGKLSGQPGIQERFGTSLVDRFSVFLPVRPNDAFYINDPTDHAFEACFSAHIWLDNLRLADRRARRGLADYTDEYFDRFYGQAGAVVIRQLSDAATDVGSYWLTAWRNAGQPPLPGR